MNTKYIQKENEIFHVHTYRCGHASSDSDEAYVLKAIELGAPRIVFTDHAPFPDDRFGSRMRISEYSAYLESIESLRDKYANKIEVLCGLEIEYFKEYLEYYHELKESDKLDILILGQHMYQHEDGTFNFSDKDRSGEYSGISRAIVDGINTGLFEAVAHPDRAFTRYKKWDKDTQLAAENIVEAATLKNVLLEKNYSSMYREHNFVSQFWDIPATKQLTIYGYDAHSVENITTIRKMLVN